MCGARPVREGTIDQAAAAGDIRPPTGYHGHDGPDGLFRLPRPRDLVLDVVCASGLEVVLLG